MHSFAAAVGSGLGPRPDLDAPNGDVADVPEAEVEKRYCEDVDVARLPDEVAILDHDILRVAARQ
jgi:hypothetical protein